MTAAGPGHGDRVRAGGDAAPSAADDAVSGALDRALRLAEALVFASPDPVPPRRLAAVLDDDAPDAERVFETLAARFRGRGVELVPVGGGWQLRTAPDLRAVLARVVEKPRRLPRAAMETLAVIAWDGPCTRAEIEDRRGVSLAQGTLELLLDEGLVRPAGHREVPGRPGLWDTTPEFLARFGLRTRGDLPPRREMLSDAAPVPDPLSDPSAAPVSGSGAPVLASDRRTDPDAA